jgi:2OG-Fe(II) oxygenase superfamily
MNTGTQSMWKWPKDLASLKENFITDRPFPHIVIDDVFPADIVGRAYSQIPPLDDEAWIHWGGGRKEECGQAFSKRGISDIERLPDQIRSLLDLLSSRAFIEELCTLTGIPGLIVDRSFNGGGLHCSGRGAALRIHADPIRHPQPDQFDQAINLILYVNPHWQEEFGGNLELWSRDCSGCEVSIAPMFNRLVIFQADRTSFHGHPEPNKCPTDQHRASLAVYYYTKRENAVALDGNRPIWR